MPGAAGLPADGAAVGVGQSQVEDDEVRGVAIHRLQGRGAGAGDARAVAGLLQLDLQEPGDQGSSSTTRTLWASEATARR